MKRSEHRILTTHAGRLDGPAELMKLSRDVMAGHAADVNALRPAVQRGIVEVVRKQADAGVDVISDGEVGKFGFGSLAYYGRRLSGLTTRPLKPGEAPFMALETNERIEFAEFCKDLNSCRRPRSASSAAVP
jgi:5-methyltetrahydropteroyltriglutamate--homocysteine methyltransferase